MMAQCDGCGQRVEGSLFVWTREFPGPPVQTCLCEGCREEQNVVRLAPVADQSPRQLRRDHARARDDNLEIWIERGRRYWVRALHAA